MDTSYKNLFKWISDPIFLIAYETPHVFAKNYQDMLRLNHLELRKFLSNHVYLRKFTSICEV